MPIATTNAFVLPTNSRLDRVGKGSSVKTSSTAAAEFFAAYLQDSVQLDLDAFVWPENLRPTSSHKQFADNNEIPEIDLGLLLKRRCISEASRQLIARKMAQAAKEWGFFRIVNHGLPSDLMSRAEKQAHKLFSLPLEHKLRASGSTSSPFGYAAAGPSRAVMRSWHETLYLLCKANKIEDLARKLWPEDADNRDFCADLCAYTIEMNKLAQIILELLLLGIGVGAKDRKCFSQCYSVEGTSSARINYYPPCPQPEVTFGLPPHTDSGTLTILHQDSVGGLQVRKNGKWVGVEPKTGSFIVNIGDCFQAWSNEVYKSVEHRALVNSTCARMSMAFFYNPTDDTVIQPLKDVTTCSKAPVYKPFTWAHYRSFAGTHKSKEMNALDHFKLVQ